MSYRKFSLNIILCVLASILLAGASARAQDKVAANAKTDLAQMRLENVRLERESLGELFSALSFAYNIPIGLEIARGDYEPSLYRIDFQKGTLPELLQQFVKKHDLYDWKIQDGVVSIFPKEEYRDPLVRELLLTEISSFSVPVKTSVFGFGKNLLSTPEAKKILGTYETNYDSFILSGFYIPQLGQKFSFEVSDIQVKSILDKVIKESPVARSWTIYNHSSHQVFVLQIKTKPEGAREDLPVPEFPLHYYFPEL